MLRQRSFVTVVVMDTEALLVVAEFSRDVAVLQWPAQREQRAELARLELPRLLVLEARSEPPPPSPSCLEDWTRVPVHNADLRARLETLVARSRSHSTTPRLDPLGQLWHRGACATLSPTEERLATVFIGRFGEIVGDDDLLDAGWDDRDASDGALRVHLTRLRRRLRPLGLEIKSRRAVGHVMRDAGAADAELVGTSVPTPA
jgi:hypothetical protein